MGHGAFADLNMLSLHFPMGYSMLRTKSMLS